MNNFEKELFIKQDEKYKNIAGVDEAGRGALAGPIVVACVCLPLEYFNKDIKDSKMLTKNKREYLYNVILKNALYYSVSILSNKDVEIFNPKKASQIGMKIVINKISHNNILYLIDAEKLNIYNKQTISIIKGDQKSQCIAAASIIAKVTRDRIMNSLHKKHPQYNWKNNKGYGTKKHLEAIQIYKVTNYHRKTYKPIKQILKNQFI